MNRVRLVGVAVLACGLSGLPPASAHPTPQCVASSFSPAFARDRTAFCVALSGDSGLGVHRSVDAGRTWSSAVRLADGPSVIARIQVSENFPTDRTVYAVTDEGIFRSTDAAASFRRIFDAPASPPPPWALTSYGSNLAWAVPGPATASQVFDADLGARPVAGGVRNTQRFIVAGTGQPFASAVAIASLDDGASPAAYACTADFVCVERMATFGGLLVAAGRTAPTGPEYVVTSDGQQWRVWRSEAAGRAWQRWSSLEMTLVRFGVDPFAAYLDVTANPAQPSRMFVLTRGDGRRSATKVPAWQLFRSQDGGRSWARIGFSWATDQIRRSRNSLPWNDRPDVSADSDFARISAQAGGRLYVAAAAKQPGGTPYVGLFCSRDEGRTWMRGCT